MLRRGPCASRWGQVESRTLRRGPRVGVAGSARVEAGAAHVEAGACVEAGCARLGGTTCVEAS